jgi:hypothetical protein
MFPHSSLNPDLSRIDTKIIPLVSFINKLLIPTFYSCEGHNPAGTYQSHSPLVILSPSYTEVEALAFLRFVGMVGVHNNQKDLLSSYEEKIDFVRWDFTSRGDETILMKPQNHENFSLPVLHKGLEDLVKNLKKIEQWYLVQK